MHVHTSPQGATPLQALVATCMGQVVGVAVLRQEELVDYLRAHYNLEDFVYFNYHRPEEHGHLHHCILNPIFHGHTRHFLSVSLHCCSPTTPLSLSLSLPYYVNACVLLYVVLV